MTTMWSEWEIQGEGEVGSDSAYRDPPPMRDDVTKMKAVLPKGKAEIKPHNLNGIRAGLEQLADQPAKPPFAGPRMLITYRPVDADDKAVNAGQPVSVQVYATDYVAGVTASDLLNRYKWWFLGKVPVPKRVTVKLENRGVFGAVMEGPVRRLFRGTVLLPPRKLEPGTGGWRHGPDVVWKELAELYRELAQEMRDPFYAEVAAELAAPHR